MSIYVCFLNCHISLLSLWSLRCSPNFRFFSNNQKLRVCLFITQTVNPVVCGCLVTGWEMFFCYFFRIHFHEIIMMAERNEWQKEKGARWTTNYGIWRKYYRGRQVKLGESGFVIVLLVGTCN